MKKWVLTVFSRIGDLVIKAISYKTAVAIVVTIVFILKAQDAGVLGFALVVLTWLATISFRFLEKTAAAAGKIIPHANQDKSAQVGQ